MGGSLNAWADGKEGRKERGGARKDSNGVLERRAFEMPLRGFPFLGEDACFVSVTKRKKDTTVCPAIFIDGNRTYLCADCADYKD